jgi:hypothetical protein
VNRRSFLTLRALARFQDLLRFAESAPHKRPAVGQQGQRRRMWRGRIDIS